MTSEQAHAIVDDMMAWVGWDMWEPDRSDICLDGHFTLEQLEALLIVLREPPKDKP